MTPAERALLLAVAKTLRLNVGPGAAHVLAPLIAAVEAETAPETPSKSCHTCRFTIAVCGYSTAIPGCGWQPKPTEAVCQMCNGTGMTVFNACQDMCWVCDGTGKKEKK